MGKDRFFIMALFATIITFGLTACGGSKDDPDENGSKDSKVSVTLTSSDLTPDGYFDGLLYYQITSNSTNEVTVSKANESATSVNIPSAIKIDDKIYTCTSISKNAFRYSDLVSVNIPNSITSIGEYAFYGCDFGTIELPSGITSIESYTFSRCRNLTQISIPNGVKSIGDNAFSECDNLTSITLPEGVITIGLRAFQYCTNLSSINFPEGLETIGSEVFWNCTSLTTIIFPSSLKRIGDRCFYAQYTSNITSMHFKSTTPPIVGSEIEYQEGNLFLTTYEYDNVKIYIPRGSYNAYKSKYPFSIFRYLLEE